MKNIETIKTRMYPSRTMLHNTFIVSFSEESPGYRRDIATTKKTGYPKDLVTLLRKRY